MDPYGVVVEGTSSLYLIGMSLAFTGVNVWLTLRESRILTLEDWITFGVAMAGLALFYASFCFRPRHAAAASPASLAFGAWVGPLALPTALVATFLTDLEAHLRWVAFAILLFSLATQRCVQQRRIVSCCRLVHERCGLCCCSCCKRPHLADVVDKLAVEAAVQ